MRWRQRSFIQEEREISSSVIGEIVMDAPEGPGCSGLCEICVGVREFKDVSTFMDELKKFLKD